MGIDAARFAISIGSLPRGPKNTIADVTGVRVGHCTLSEGEVQTGVTVVLPHGGNVFREKVVAGCHVINGFGKTIGTVQIEELGTLETPIVLTNTLSVGTAATALVRYMLAQNPDIGLSTGTVNPVVCECNDGKLSAIRGLHVQEEHVMAALENASEEVVEGAVGAGRGMICYGFKGGIGTASRIVVLDGKAYILGALVLTNFGSKNRLIVDGDKVGQRLADLEQQDKGSVIVILATDAPVNERQLRRLCKRVPAGLARTGSYYGHGSGDIALGFTTAGKVPHDHETCIDTVERLHDDGIGGLFIAVMEATEEAVLSSMLHGEAVTGRDGVTIPTLGAYLT